MCLALTICTTPDEGSGAPGINTATWPLLKRNVIKKEPKLTSIVHAHQDRLEVFVCLCLHPCQAISVFSKGDVGRQFV